MWKAEKIREWEVGKLGGCEVGKLGRCEDGRRKNRMQKSEFSKQIVNFFYLKPGALRLKPYTVYPYT
jgi:hypothetical protein